MRGIVPDYVLDGPKYGFGVPFSYWLSSSLYKYAKEIFNESLNRPDTFFDRKTLMSLLGNHKIAPTDQSGFILWKALNLAIWQEKYIKR